LDSVLPPDLARLRDTVRLLELQQRVLAGLAARAELEALAALLERR
jgi:hypothetical protein